MSGTVNRVILLGNLGQDPEGRSTNDGTRVVSLSLATSETWKNREGERQERSTWHKVVIFNERLGEVAEKYLRKGSKVYLEGQLQTRKFTDRDGNERHVIEVVLQRFRGELVIIDGGKREDDAPAEPRRTYASRRNPPDDDIPF